MVDTVDLSKLPIVEEPKEDKVDLSKLPIVQEDTVDLAKLPVVEEPVPSATKELEYSLDEKALQFIGKVTAPLAPAIAWVGKQFNPDADRQAANQDRTFRENLDPVTQENAAKYASPAEVANAKWTTAQLEQAVKAGAASKGEVQRYNQAKLKMDVWATNPHMKVHTLVPLPKDTTQGMSGLVSQEEVYAIARKYGLNPEELESRVNLYGGKIEGKDEASSLVQSALGFADSSIMEGLGKIIDKKDLGVTDKKIHYEVDEL